ncbi:hypothetical protein [Ammoniphilus sp. CFH 90114]|uniref:hypothetical protein n=1 Tax=Ammoniphilus sp. CFH 90114 TaxID=2493665 RepID=UPI00100F1C0F|nr:hypothetical protein [Ammoniphilus sp. CFH 90114]RXT08111.1 hypothetical protein EIZ39_11940 [Ammoniphilus sp. CFH 90114]
MLKKGLIVTAFLAAQLLLAGCAQEKVMDTELIRLQNKVKDLETAQKLKEDESAQLTQKIMGLEEQIEKHNGQLATLLEASQAVKNEEIFPVIIQDVKLTSDKMDQHGRIWGGFNLNVTLYNGTDQPIEDSISAIIVEDHPEKLTEPPRVQNMVQKFEIKPKEAKIITFTDIPINEPSKRFNVIVKLLEQTKSGTTSGVPGKATWVVVPTVVFPPNGQ